MADEESSSPVRLKTISAEGVIPSHLFVELTSLDELSFPTSSSARIKYTCLSASAHYLAVGSTSGTVYLFSRYAARYRKSLSSVPVQVIASKEGAVVKVLVAGNEKHLAVATSRGHVSIASLASGAPTTVLNNTLHKGAVVTSLVWAEDGSKLLAADSKGLVSCSRVAGRNLFRAACEPLLEADSGVVQLDMDGDSVLISTTTRCQLFHLGRSACTQVGKKLRHDPCGAVFARPDGAERSLIFAGRPNGRLWETNSEGAVYSTHQFSQLAAVPRAPVATFRNEFDPDSVPSPETIHFGRMHAIYLQEQTFILVVNESRLCVVEPQKARVVLICDVGHSAREYAVCGNDVFLLCELNGALRKLSLFPLSKAVEKLHWRECYKQAAQVLLAYGRSLPPPSPWKTETVLDVLNHVKDDEEFDSVMIEQLTTLLQTAKRRDANAKTSTVMRLSTGVHRVVRIMENSGYDDDFTFRAPSPLRPKRSRSSPNIDEMIMASGGGDGRDREESTAENNARKRLSLPAGAVARMQQEEDEAAERNAYDEMDEIGRSAQARRDPGRRMDIYRSDSDRRPADRVRRRPASRSEESLQTLLDAAKESRELHFESETTLADAKNDLEAVDQLRLPQLHMRYRSPVVNLNNEHELEDRLLRSLEEGGRKVLDRLSRFGKSGHVTKDISFPQEHIEVMTSTTPVAVPLALMPEYPEVKRSTHKTRHRRTVNINSNSSSHQEIAHNSSQPVTISRQYQYSRDSHANDSLSSPSESLPATIITQADVHRSSSSDDFVRQAQQSFTSRPEDNRRNNEVTSTTTSSPVDDKDSALESSDSPTETDTAHQVSCLHCGLHRSWFYLFKLGKLVSAVPVSPDDYLQGGVPASVKQWLELFRICVSSRSSGNNSSPLCRSCAQLFDSHNEQEERSRAETQNIQIDNITQTARSIENEQLKRLYSAKDTSQPSPVVAENATTNGERKYNDIIDSKEQKSIELESLATPTRYWNNSESNQTTPTSDMLAYSTYVNPAYSSMEDTATRFAWTGSVRLSDLCLAMSYVLGVDAVFDLLESNATLTSALDVQDWAKLATLIRPPHSRTELGPQELLDALFRDIADGRETPTRIRYSTTNGQTSFTPQTGFVLSVIEQCPCCTLPLNIRVSDSERKLTVFDCGHAYHSVCLFQGDSLKVCIQCSLQRV